MKEVDPMYISNCCKALMNTDNEGVTHWFICTKCNKRCFFSKEVKQTDMVTLLEDAMVEMANYGLECRKLEKLLYELISSK